MSADFKTLAALVLLCLFGPPSVFAQNEVEDPFKSELFQPPGAKRTSPPDSKPRIIEFPSDREYGWLYFYKDVTEKRDALNRGGYLVPEFGSATARGRVVVPAGAEVYWSMGTPGRNYMSLRPLENLNPSDLQGMMLYGLYPNRSQVETMKGLRLLKLKVNRLDSRAAWLKDITEVEAVHIDTEAIDVETARILAQLPNIKSLWLTMTRLRDSDMQLIGNIGTLESLNLTSSGFITDDGFMHLAELKNLRYLDLSGTRVSDDSLPIIAGMQKITKLNLTWTTSPDASCITSQACPTCKNSSWTRDVSRTKT